jgi:hypothetical protein
MLLIFFFFCPVDWDVQLSSILLSRCQIAWFGNWPLQTIIDVSLKKARCRHTKGSLNLLYPFTHPSPPFHLSPLFLTATILRIVFEDADRNREFEYAHLQGSPWCSGRRRFWWNWRPLQRYELGLWSRQSKCRIRCRIRQNRREEELPRFWNRWHFHHEFERHTISNSYSSSRVSFRFLFVLCPLTILSEWEDDSPYPEVRAAVPNTDDPSIPVNTFRVWVLGFLTALIFPSLNGFFGLRCEFSLWSQSFFLKRHSQIPLYTSALWWSSC